MQSKIKERLCNWRFLYLLSLLAIIVGDAYRVQESLPDGKSKLSSMAAEPKSLVLANIPDC